jgi:hypothetical protein
LQEESQQFVQQQVQEQIKGIAKSPGFDTEKMPVQAYEEKQPVNAVKQKEIPQQLQEKNQTQNSISFWIWVYIALNIALAYFGYRIDEVLIVLMISFLTVITVLIRKDKPHPFNWLVKLFLLAQIAFFVFLEMRWLDYMFQIRVSQIIIALFFINFILLFKGNRNK